MDPTTLKLTNVPPVVPPSGQTVSGVSKGEQGDHTCSQVGAYHGAVGIVQVADGIESCRRMKIYSEKLPRYVHDLLNTISTLICNVEIMGSRDPDFVGVEQKVLANLYKLCLGKPNQFDKWISLTKDAVNGDSPVQAGCDFGIQLEKELQRILDPIIQYVASKAAKKDELSEKRKMLEKQANAVLGSIRNFNETCFNEDYIGKPSSFNPYQICCEMISILRNSSPGLRLTLHNPIQEGLQAQCCMDVYYLRNCIENIVGNSAKAAKQLQVSSPEKIDFITTVKNTGGYIEIILEDKGPGLPKDIIDKVMRGEDGASVSQSLGEIKASENGGIGVSQGYGMQNVIRYIRAVEGGSVEITSSRDTENHFTRFTLKLPVKKEEFALEETRAIRESANGLLMPKKLDQAETDLRLTEKQRENLVLVLHPFGARAIAQVLNAGKKEEDLGFFHAVAIKSYKDCLTMLETHTPKAIIIVEGMKTEEMTIEELIGKIKMTDRPLPKIFFSTRKNDIEIESVATIPFPIDYFALDEQIIRAINNS